MSQRKDRGDDSDTTHPTGGSSSGGYDPTQEGWQEPGETLADPAAEATLTDGPTIPAPSLPSTAFPSAGAGKVFAGRFEVVREIGSGGMGKVYQVRDRQIDGRLVALKVLHPRFSRNDRFRTLFFQEIRAAQNFVSEYVVQVRDTGQMQDGTLFLTMDMVEGESLSGLLSRESSLRARHALELTRQVLLGLDSGHAQGFVHRDVKPSNVMLAARVPKTDANPYGVGVRLLDFGIAGLAAQVEEGAVTGTPKYMSPEQIQGQRLDARSDLFAVGILLYEMLSGSRPFEGDTLEEITTSVIETDLDPLIREIEELSTPVRRILKKALQKDREKRYQNAAEFIKAIERSKAFKLPSAMPAWATVTLGVFAVGAVVEAKMLLDMNELLDHQAEDNRLLGNRLGDSENRNNELQSQLNALQAKRTDDIGEKTTKIEETGTKEDIVQWKTQYDEVIEDLRAINQDLAATKAKLDEEARKREEAEKQALVFKEKYETEVRESRPDAMAARGFDTLLERIEGGLAASAKDKLRSLESEGVFALGSSDGRALVQPLVECAASMQAFEVASKSGPPDLELLQQASRQHREAADALPGLATVAKAWLPYKLEGEAEPQRVQRAQAALDALGTRITEIQAGLESLDAGDWEKVTARPASSDPSPAFAHADRFGCGHLSELFESTAVALEELAAPGGKLDLGALESLDALDGWGERLRREPKKSLTPAQRTLLLLAWARRFHDEDPGNDAFDWQGIELPAVTQRAKDWRVELRLKSRLASTSSGFPLKNARRAIYKNSASSELAWRVEEGRLSVGGTAEGWELTRSDLDSRGVGFGPSQTLSIYRPDAAKKTFRIPNWTDPLLELRETGDAVWVEPFPALVVADPPPSVAPPPDALERFRSALALGPGPCLVYRRGNVTRWFSPELGLVRERTEGVGSFDLVFATSP